MASEWDILAEIPVTPDPQQPANDPWAVTGQYDPNITLDSVTAAYQPRGEMSAVRPGAPLVQGDIPEYTDTWGEMAEKYPSHIQGMGEMQVGGALQMMGEHRLLPQGTIGMFFPEILGEAQSGVYEDAARIGQEKYEQGRKRLEDTAYQADPYSAKEVVGSTMDALPNFLAMMAMGYFGGPLGAATSFIPVATSQYGDSRKKGRTPNQATMDAAYTFVTEYLPERIPLKVFFGTPGKFLKRLPAGILGEGGQEVLTQDLQGMYEKGVIDKDGTLQDALAYLISDEGMHSRFLAGTSGGLLGGAGVVVTQPGQAAAEKQAKESQALGDLGDMFTDGATPLQPPPEHQAKAEPHQLPQKFPVDNPWEYKAEWPSHQGPVPVPGGPSMVPEAPPAPAAPTESPGPTEPSGPTGEQLIQRTQRARDNYQKAKQVDANADSLMTAIAKLGGLSSEEAKYQGIDPADIRHAPGWRILRPFNRNGSTFDLMAENLRQFGFPYQGPNDLLDAIQAELGGQAQRTPEGQMAQAERDAQEREAQEREAQGKKDLLDSENLEAITEDDGASILDDSEFQDDMPPEDRRLIEIMAVADSLEEGAGENIVERGAIQEKTDEEIIADLKEFIRGKSATAGPDVEGAGPQAEVPMGERPAVPEAGRGGQEAPEGLEGQNESSHKQSAAIAAVYAASESWLDSDTKKLRHPEPERIRVAIERARNAGIKVEVEPSFTNSNVTYDLTDDAGNRYILIVEGESGRATWKQIRQAGKGRNEQVETERNEQAKSLRRQQFEAVVPKLQDYYQDFRAIGAERLEKAGIKPADMDATDWLLSMRDKTPTWDKGRKTGSTGIQMLSQKNLWPTDDGTGEQLRKSMLAAVRAIRNIGYDDGWLQNVERGQDPFAEPLDLQAQTPEDLDRLNREERDRQKAEQEEAQKAKADQERGGFNLTGSNRPADEAAARGQTDLTDQIDRQERQETPEQGAAPERAKLAGKPAAKESPSIPAEAEASAPSETKPVTERNRKLATKLRGLADKMDKTIDAKLNPATAGQNLTPRRARIIDSMASEGRQLQRVQRILYSLADMHETGNVPAELEQAVSRADVEYLMRDHRVPSWNPGESGWRATAHKWLLAESKGAKGAAEARRYLSDTSGPIDDTMARHIRTLQGVVRLRGGDTAANYKAVKEDLAEFNRQKKLGLLERNPHETNTEALERHLKNAKEAIEKLEEAKPAEDDKAQRIAKLERDLVGTKPGIDYFPTPKAVVERMVEEAQLEAGQKVLEPSAGKGNIADAIRDAGVEPDVVEMSSSLREILEAKGYELVASDFMEYQPGAIYDRILMNPPFSKRQDVDHVRHAYELLKPDGRIVAIMSEGPFFGTDKKAAEFRDWLDEVGTSEELDAGDLADKKVTQRSNVKGRLVVIDKTEGVAEEKAPYQGLEGIEVTQDAVVEETGTKVKITRNAGAVLAEYDSRLKSLKALLDCL